MPQTGRGEITEKPWSDGETVAYGARLYAYGRRQKVTFGTNKQGWNRRRAELELEKIRQRVERGVWVPPRLEARENREADAMAQLGVKVGESFRAFSSRWWESKRLQVADATRNDYEWRLGYLVRFFGRHELGEIDVALVDRFRDELRQQAETIRVATARGRPLTERVTDRRGRIYERRRRPLSNTSINAMIGLLGQILQQAVDHELIPRNPVRIGGRSARFLPRVKPSRTFLEIDELHALLDAAGELDAEARSNLKGLGRRAMIATLGLSGLRISELLDLRWGQVDIERSRLKVVDSLDFRGL